MNQEPLPQIHLIRDTDLSVFAYELHIFAGDFLRECEFNMRSLATNTGADSIAIMGKNHMWLSDALFAYCSTADLHQMILTTEFIGARAFLFHTDRSEGGHLYGDVLMMDLDTLRQDIKRNILYPCGVNIERKDGSAATVSLKEWTEMELYEKDALKSWGFSYAPNQVTEWQYHYSTMFRQWMDQAFRYMPQDLEERLNMQYMEAAQNPDKDKPLAEGTVKFASTWILAALRDQRFFSIREAQEAVSEKLEELNARPFRKREGCRRSAYLSEEQEFMKPLPTAAYELAVWSPDLTVGHDYLVSDGMNKYSVPFDLIGEKVNLRLTQNTVEVFYRGTRVAMHTRHRKALRDPVVKPEHMTPEHKKYLNYNEAEFTAWDSSVGEQTAAVVRYFLTSGKETEQGYKA